MDWLFSFWSRLCSMFCSVLCVQSLPVWDRRDKLSKERPLLLYFEECLTAHLLFESCPPCFTPVNQTCQCLKHSNEPFLLFCLPASVPMMYSSNKNSLILVPVFWQYRYLIHFPYRTNGQTSYCRVLFFSFEWKCFNSGKPHSLVSVVDHMGEDLVQGYVRSLLCSSRLGPWDNLSSYRPTALNPDKVPTRSSNSHNRHTAKVPNHKQAAVTEQWLFYCWTEDRNLRLWMLPSWTVWNEDEILGLGTIWGFLCINQRWSNASGSTQYLLVFW